MCVLQVGQIITDRGPDLATSCGNPNNILSVGTTYVVGIGGPCNAYGEWTPYSRYPPEHRQALANGCSNSSISVSVTAASTSVATAITTTLTISSTVTSLATSIVHATPSSGVEDNSSGNSMGATFIRSNCPHALLKLDQTRLICSLSSPLQH